MKHEDYLKGVNITWKHDDKYSELMHCRLAILEEVGEIVGWYKKIHGYKGEKSEEWKIGIKGEFGDLLYYLVKIADITDNSDLLDRYFFDKLPAIDLNEVTHVAQMSGTALRILEDSDISHQYGTLIHNLFKLLVQLMIHEGFEFEDIAVSNLKKLEKRHGSSFNIDATMESGRNREEEDKALENG